MSAGRKALRMVKALWPETKTLRVMDHRDEGKHSADESATALSDPIENNTSPWLLKDKEPWPLALAGYPDRRWWGGLLSVNPAVQQPWLPTSTNLVSTLTDLLRPLQAVTETAVYQDVFSTTNENASDVCRDGEELKLLKIDCQVSYRPNWLDPKAFQNGVTGPTGNQQEESNGLRQLLEPAYLDLFWISYEHADFVHQMQEESAIATSYNSHIPRLYQMFDSYAKYFFFNDNNNETMQGVNPPGWYITPGTVLYLPSTQYRKLIRQSRYVRHPDPLVPGPPFRVLRRLKLTSYPPKLRDVHAFIAADQSANIGKGGMEVKVVGDDMKAMMGYGEATSTTDSLNINKDISTAINTYEDPPSLGTETIGIYGVSNPRQWLCGYRKTRDFSLKGNGRTVSYHPNEYVGPGTILYHKPFGMCKEDLRLSVISTHPNSFWRLRIKCDVEFFG